MIGGLHRLSQYDGNDAKVTEAAELSALNHFHYENTNAANELGGELLAFANIIV